MEVAMSTTAIFVEVLIIGIQAAIWVTLLILSMFGYHWATTLKLNLQGWESLATIGVLSFCYTLGVIVDRLADAFYIILNPKTFLLRNKWINRNADRAHDSVRIAVLCSDKSLTNFLEYLRSRLRIARATVFNIVLTMITTLLFISTQCDTIGCESRLSLGVTTLFIGIMLSIITFFTTAMLQVTYENRLKQARQELLKGQNKDSIVTSQS
jgi:hypothetical protein